MIFPSLSAYYREDTQHDKNCDEDNRKRVVEQQVLKDPGRFIQSGNTACDIDRRGVRRDAALVGNKKQECYAACHRSKPKGTQCCIGKSAAGAAAVVSPAASEDAADASADADSVAATVPEVLRLMVAAFPV